MCPRGSSKILLVYALTAVTSAARKMAAARRIELFCAPSLMTPQFPPAAQIGGYLKSIWDKPWS
jgi:hypothetical protein